MGNRAVITTKKDWENNGIGIYLHWNGGRDSVETFLKYCELAHLRAPEYGGYGYARLCQVIGNFFGDDYCGGERGLSIGIGKLEDLDCDNWDNGVYIIEGWKIVGREYFNGKEQDSHDKQEMIEELAKHQPFEVDVSGAFTKG